MCVGRKRGLLNLYIGYFEFQKLSFNKIDDFIYFWTRVLRSMRAINKKLISMIFTFSHVVHMHPKSNQA